MMSPTLEKLCRVCNSEVGILLDFDKQPRSFDYHIGYEIVEKFNFQLGQCLRCGTIQLVDEIPSNKMIPKCNWLENKEPTEHLYIVVEFLKDLLKDRKAKILFVSKYDEKIYKIVVDCENVIAQIIEPKEDLGLESSYVSQATLQNKYVYSAIKEIINKYGKFDIIISCRMLEHTHQPSEFIKNLSLLLKDKGKMVIEIPDSRKPLVQTDVAMLWEEHLSYFTPSTLNNLMNLNGLKLIQNIIYEYPQEDALIGIFEKENNSTHLKKLISSFQIDGEIELGNQFKIKLKRFKLAFRNFIQKTRKEHGEIVFFGAGHRGISFLNLMEVDSNTIKYILDDDDNKSRLRIPGIGIEIVKSDSISFYDIGVCIFAIDIKIENVIEAKS